MNLWLNGMCRTGIFSLIILMSLGLMGTAAASQDYTRADCQKLADSANSRFDARDFRFSADIMEEAVTACESTTLPDDTVLLANLNKLSFTCYVIGEYERGERWALRSLEISDSSFGQNHIQFARSLTMVGLHAWSLERLDEAVKHYTRAIKIFDTQGDPDSEDIAKASHNLALVYWKLEEYDSARTRTRRAQEIWEKVKGPDFAHIGASLNLQGILSSELGEHEEAEVAYSKALDLRERVLGPDHYQVASSLNGLANLYLSLGFFDKAEPLIYRAHDIWMASLGTSHPSCLVAMTVKARLHRIKGEYDKAESLLLEASEGMEEKMGPDSRRLAQCLGNIGNVYLDMGRFVEAEKAFTRARDILLKNPQDEDRILGLTLNNLAISMYRQGNLEEAAVVLEESLKRFSSIEGLDYHERTYSYARYTFARIQVGRGDLELGEKEFLDQVDSANTDGNTFERTYMLALRDLARINALRGDIEQSLKYYEDFFSTRREFLDYAFASSSEAQKIRWLRLYPLIDPSMISLAVQEPNSRCSDVALELVINSKSVVTDALIAEYKGAFSSCDESLTSILEDRERICTRIANMVLAEVASPTEMEFEEDLEDLKRQKDSIETLLSGLCADFQEDSKTAYVRVDEVARSLPEGSLLCEYLVYCPYTFDQAQFASQASRESHYALLTLDPAGTTSVIDLGPTGTIDSLIRRAREQVYEAAPDVYSPRANIAETALKETTSQLTEYLLSPVINMETAPKTLLIAPDGLINLLPLEILPLPDDSYLIEKFRISYITGGRDLVEESSSEQAGGNVLLIADPDFDALPFEAPPNPDSIQAKTVFAYADLRSDEYLYENCPGTAFSQMPAARKEVESLSEFFDETKGFSTVVVSGPNASEELFKNLSDHPDIIHLATHGFFCNRDETSSTITDNPLVRSGLALTGANVIRNTVIDWVEYQEDGILTALEVSSLNLHGNRLTVLSACESGVGAVLHGDGFFGMRRAFRSAGSRSQMMSLWKVPNRATTELMTGFYDRWLGGETRIDALRGSILELMASTQAKRGHRHPLVWGGFVIVGSPE